MIDAQGNLFAAPAGAYVAPAAGLGEYWVHPNRLAAAKDEQSQTHLIYRLNYKLGETTFKAIAYTTFGQNASFHYVFDTESGMMLYYGACSPIQGGGSMVVSVVYKETRDLKLPWANSPVPPGAAKGQQLVYRGTQNTLIPGAPPVGSSLTASFAFAELGKNWIFSKLTNTIDARGITANSETVTERALGAGSATPMWIDPNILRRLEPNKLIDEDKLARTRVTYAGVKGNTAVVVEQSQIETLQISYDLNTGWMSGLSHVYSTGPSQIQTQVQYVGMK
jgi:hypothetical protein